MLITSEAIIHTYRSSTDNQIINRFMLEYIKKQIIKHLILF